MKTSIVVLHFGDPEVTKACLKSIFESKVSFESLVVVDNGGNFDNKNKGIRLIRNKKNLGFAGGVNVGIKYALSKNADYILLLNNDTKIDMDFIKPLEEFAKFSTDIGILGPAIKFKKKGKMVYDLGGKINKFFGRTTHKEVFRIVDRKPRKVDYVSGCAMLIKKEVFGKVGLFDERFFLYYEDVDFCIRAKSRGFLTYVIPEVYIEHELSKTVGKASSLAIYHQTKSALLFGKKHFGRLLLLKRAFIIVQILIIFLKNPRTGVSAIAALKYL